RGCTSARRRRAGAAGCARPGRRPPPSLRPGAAVRVPRARAAAGRRGVSAWHRPYRAPAACGAARTIGSGMRTIRRGGEHQIDIKKSRFICALARVADEDEARAFIAERRRLHWNAAHNCTAYVLGPDGEVQRSSDDGEPSGTAGVPMLEVLRHREITDAVAVVTRYFGGIKLGAGGLIRAYGGAVSAAVDELGLLERRRLLVVAVMADYLHAGRLESDLRSSPYPVRSVEYGADVRIDVALPEGGLAEFEAWLAEATAGQAVSEVVGTAEVEVEPEADG